jgi:hypothetical protein
MPTPFVSPADEMAGLTLFLDLQRAAVLAKLEGLSDRDAARRSTPSSLSVLTVVKHLASTTPAFPTTTESTCAG